jgi:hypothetical protein
MGRATRPSDACHPAKALAFLFHAEASITVAVIILLHGSSPLYKRHSLLSLQISTPFDDQDASFAALISGFLARCPIVHVGSMILIYF